ncbi:class I SAM-dependent methyltransferase [Halolamina sp. CBA1230]|uniref:class I SAM-dependent methyltransferase n=1 Tax=Halolamina sp. CBA1230 TaxID=1853690 RepID=UPI001301D80A|nr:class I SAM-dependent methyltransferase [Halolamina sp. CBA1230]QKY19092.1 class I SAM-dependent methyltransferase [Halolamina sp. CBA1230]
MDENDNTARNQLQRGYDVLAENASDLDRERSPWGDSHFQEHYSWPATRPVLPELADRRVLLAGCGRGDYVPWFHEQGATVVGVDASETAIQQARQRFGQKATFYHANLTNPLDFADSDTFDLVFSNLVLSHIEEWTPVFEEFHRVLRPQQPLVVTTIHPHYLRSDTEVEEYYTVTKLMNDWPDVEIPTYYRPMNAVITPFIEAGFQLETVDEPQPQDAFAEHHPERYQDALRQPDLLVIRAQVD